MKNYSYKYTFKYLALTLLLAISMPLFAADFAEQRKVIIPQFANAVYKDLTVLDKMILELEENSNRTFLLELGKRPTYFWDSDKMFYLYQNSTLNLRDVVYVPQNTNENVFLIDNMNINGTKGGSFYSEKMVINNGSNIVIRHESSSLLINFTDDFNAKLEVLSPAADIFVYALKYGMISGEAGLNNNLIITSLWARDIQFSNIDDNNNSYTVKFPSPRMIVYENNGNYYAKGTATKFELASGSRTIAPKHYFGPWEVYNSGKLTTSSGNPCGSSLPHSGDDAACAYSVMRGSQNFRYDNINDKFTCDAGDDEANPNNACYDYQEINLNDISQPFNNNIAYYEFKVEEIYQVSNGTARLISQTPNAMLIASSTSGWQPAPLLKFNTNNWSPNEGLTIPYAVIDGTMKPLISGPKLLTSVQETNPCFYICNGKPCDNNKLYIREINQTEDGKTHRILKGGANSPSNNWPDFEGEKQELHIFTLTVGFCPKVTAIDSEYEINFTSPVTVSNEIDALLIKSGSNWVQPKVCVRRLVKCDSIQNESGHVRKYTLLSTNY